MLASRRHGLDPRPYAETGQGQESEEGGLINLRAGGNARPLFGKDSHHEIITENDEDCDHRV